MIEKNQPVNFWFGVVTVIDDDPERLGRVRVRIFGKHHQDPNILSNDNLPLAQVLMPPIYASLSGIGKTPTGLLPGSWVIGFFMDPEIENMPIILGSLPSMQFPEDAQKEVTDQKDKSGKQADMIYGIKKDDQSGWVNKSQKYGFCDPNEIFPTYSSQLPDGKKLNAADVNSKVQHSFEYTEADFRHRKDSLLIACNAKGEKKPTLDSGGIKEPFMAEPEYMFNHVYESQSGHIKEYDDTPGKERIYEQHKSGTFQEIQHDGTKVTKVFGEDFELCLNGKQLIINSGESGSNGLNIVVNGDININSAGSVIQRIYGDYTTVIHGELKYNVKKNVTIESWFGDINFITHNKKKFSVKANGPINLESDDAIGIKAKTVVSIGRFTTLSDDFSVSGNTTCDGDLLVTGRSNAVNGASSLGKRVIITPPRHPLSPSDGDATGANIQQIPGQDDKKDYPYNKGPLLCWSTKKSAGKGSGWDYHKPDAKSTNHKKHLTGHNFYPIGGVSKNSFQGDDSKASSVTTDFKTFDYFKFTYNQDKSFEWYEKPYKNEKERDDSGQIFRKSTKVDCKSKDSLGYANA